MRANTTKQYLYTGDLYGYTVVTSADGTTTENVYVEVPAKVSLALSVNLLGDLVIESESKMQLNAYLQNIVDANGEEIYVDGQWKIVQTSPLLGPMGLKAGYKYRAQIIAGNV
jgi:hypothetical protein